MEHAIKVKDLSKSFAGRPAVDHIGFEVASGEIFGFLGPNGAGKTTTQRMLTGILEPDGGSIEILGHNMLKRPAEAKMMMGVVPEMSNTYVDLSAWDNMMLMGRLYQMGKKKRKRRALELLELFGLADKKKQKTKTFSKGMKQRLTLAAALMNEPRLLLLDEPTSGLDVQSARLIKDLVTALNQNGVTVFLTTHNIEEANRMCHRVAIINQGRIAALDRPAVLRSAIDSVQSVEVVFGRPVEHFNPLLDTGLISEVRQEGDKFRFFSDKPGEAACRIVEYAGRQQLEVLSLNTCGPSLEDAFVHLTGV